MASLMSAGDILVQNDLAYERYDQPTPLQVEQDLTPTPDGSRAARPAYGTSAAERVADPRDRRGHRGRYLPTSPSRRPLEVYPVDDPRQIVRAEPQTAPLIVDGDAEGIAAAADVGLLAGNPTVLYAATLDGQPGAMQQAAESGATLVVTDTDRKREFPLELRRPERRLHARRRRKSRPTTRQKNPSTASCRRRRDSQTVTVFEGVKSVVASDYGNDLQFLPEDRASVALDGDTQTAWQTSAFADPVGQWWQVTLDQPDHHRSRQPAAGDKRLTRPMDHERDPDVRRHAGPCTSHSVRRRGSPSGAGQTVTFPTTTFKSLRITIDGTNLNQAGNPASLPGVGFAEVRIPGVTMQEFVSLPEDMLQADRAPRRTTTASSSSSRDCGSLQSRRGAIRRSACRGSSGSRRRARSC